MDDTIFENERYAVLVGDFDLPSNSHKADFSRGYIVMNKITRVEEVHTPQLPDAIASAEQLDLAMEQEIWKWIRIQDSAEAMIQAVEGSGDETIH